MAVAGLVSAPAFAQSNVTIYGIVDVGVAHHSGSSTHDSRTGIDSGIQSGSRIGFRGVEDLGNGLKAAFVLEYGIKNDQNYGIGHGTDSDNLQGSTARQQYLALVGGFGTVALGRLETPQHQFLAGIDPFGDGTVGTYATAYSKVTRLNNVAAYISPDFGGFTVTAAYTADGLDDEESTPKALKSGDLEVWAINPVYKNGPLVAGVNYQRAEIDNGAVDFKQWDLAGAYDFGPVRLSAIYGQIDYDQAAATHDKRKQWVLGAAVPVGAAGKVLVSYSEFDLEGKGANKDLDGSKWAVGYTHDLSKRTNLYAAYAKTSDDLGLKSTSGAVENDPYTKGFNLGIRHKF
ncbi:porin [Pseudothauera rhizosphaerae]|uniref:porin n=1 Tax=Pseudothauera rhizosphaerae TaxID=2565932 RepID=UPI0022AA0B9F|nr:porin [Pseudothauera rhizosphaerae]